MDFRITKTAQTESPVQYNHHGQILVLRIAVQYYLSYSGHLIIQLQVSMAHKVSTYERLLFVKIYEVCRWDLSMDGWVSAQARVLL